MAPRALKEGVIIAAILSLFYTDCPSLRQEPLHISQDKLAYPRPTELHSPQATKINTCPPKKLSAAPLSKKSTITGSSVLDLFAIITFLYLIIKPLIRVARLEHERSYHKNPPFQNPPCNQRKTGDFVQNTNPENQYQQEQLIKETEKAKEGLRKETENAKKELREETEKAKEGLRKETEKTKEELKNYVDNMTLGKYERGIQGQRHLFEYNYTKRFSQFNDGNS